MFPQEICVLQPGKIWKTAKQEKDIIVTSNGRPIAIIAGVDEDSFEEELDMIQRARALKALDRIQKESVIKGSNRITNVDIQSEIKKARKSKTI